MKKHLLQNREHPISNLSVVLLIGLFASFSLLIVIFSINVYRNIIGVSDQNSDARAAVFYITNKIRSADQADTISIDNTTEVTYLLIQHHYSAQQYQTMIYYYDGAIREILVPSGEYPDPQDGDVIVYTDGFEISKEGNLIEFSVMMDGDQDHQMHLALQSEQ